MRTAARAKTKHPAPKHTHKPYYQKLLGHKLNESSWPESVRFAKLIIGTSTITVTSTLRSSTSTVSRLRHNHEHKHTQARAQTQSRASHATSRSQTIHAPLEQHKTHCIGVTSGFGGRFRGALMAVVRLSCALMRLRTCSSNQHTQPTWATPPL